LAQVNLDGVTKRFGEAVAVDDLTLAVDDGELLVLLGSSGCGKTTVLRLVAGLDEVSEGTVRIGGRVVDDVDPKDRDVAMVFQSYALYPHLSAAGNIEFPLRQRGVDKAERAARVTRAAAALGLTDLLDRKPSRLSGGQRQRVALARALVREPAVFLMDEPLSNLDAARRVETRADIVELQSRLRTTTLYVTHDQVEAMTMGHRIAVMNAGRLEQIATPEDLYATPENVFVAGFLGNPGMNLVEGRLDASAGDGWCVTFPGGSVPLPRAWRDIGTPEGLGARGGLDSTPDAGAAIVLGLRPEALALRDDGPVTARVVLVEPLGAETHVICHTESGTRIVVRQDPRAVRPRLGAPVRIAVDPEPASYHLFSARTGQRLGPVR
jgi:multiple sugar transport system ATP-binding protein